MNAEKRKFFFACPLCMVQGHAHERRQCDNVSEQDISCSGHALLCQSNPLASQTLWLVLPRRCR